MKPLLGLSLVVLAWVGAGLRTASAQVTNPSRIHQLKSLKVVKISAAGHNFNAWLMDNEEKNAEGMMFLTDKEVKSNEGMLFIFPKVQPGDKEHGFWMHNTLIPLDIIYIGASKKVINIAEAKALDDTSRLALAPYFYVVEFKRGTARALGIKPGTKFEIPSGLKWVD